MEIIQILFAVIVAVIVGFYIIPLVIRVAIKKDLVAKPNHRTSHTGRIPNIGGVAIFIAFVIAFLFTAYKGITLEIQYFILATIILFFVGLLDDILIISAKKKLYGELIAILAIVTLGDVRLTNLHGFFGVYELHYMVSVVLTVFVAVVIINGLNLIDGIDGLASGVGMLIAAFFTVYFEFCGLEQAHLFAVLSASLFGSLIPFFAFNVFAKRNKIFMGDAGALVLGLIISILTIKFVEINIAGNPCALPVHNAPVVALCILVIPMFDTIRVFAIRIANKRSPFSPDKNHLHHILIATGLNHKAATAILVATNLIFIGIGLLLQDMNVYFLFSLVFFLALGLTEGLNTYVRIKKKRALVMLSNQV